MAGKSVKPQVKKKRTIWGTTYSGATYPWLVYSGATYPWLVLFPGKKTVAFSQHFLALLFAVKVCDSPTLMQDED